MSAHIFGWSARVFERLHKTVAAATLLAMVLALAPIGGVHFAEAARSVGSVLVDGASSGSFIPSEAVNVTVEVTTTGTGEANDWESTAWRVGGSGAFSCEDTADHTTTGTYTETFSITAPSTVGSYGLEVVAYNDAGCTAASPSTTFSLANAIVVVEPFAETFNITDDNQFDGTKMSDPTGFDATSIAGSSSNSGGDQTRNSNALNKFAKIGQDEYVCASVDATGFANLALSYAWKGDADSESSDQGIVEYKTSGSCDDASGWTEFSSVSTNVTSWQTVTNSALPDGLDDNSFILRFRNDSNNTNENWRVDDVVVSGDEASYGTLRVIKTVINDNGGTANPEDFSFSVNDASATVFESDGQNDITVLTGTYTVTEVDGPGGYAATYDNCTNVTVSAGGTTTCTITNDDVAPTLTIVKETTGGNDTFGFTATDNDTFTDTYSVTTGGSSGETEVIDLPSAGTYDITETTIPTDWDFGSVSCTINDSASGSDITHGKTITVGIGDEAVCTFGNTKRGSVSVTKYSDPADETYQFQFGLTGPNEYSDSHTFNPEGTWLFSSLIPGNYSLSETILSPEGWTGSQAIACDGNGTGEENDPSGSIANPFALLLDAGEGLSCIVNNTQDAVISGKKFEDEDGMGDGVDGSGLSGWTITLEKQIVDDPETEEVESGWAALPSDTTDAEGDYAFVVQPGTYRVCEESQTDWIQSYPGTSTECAYGNGYSITAEAGALYNGNDFGNYQLGAISGNKFYDADADGSWNTETEDGLEGWIIYIDENENNQRDEGEPYTTTDNTGHYVITDVEPGTYMLREELPAEESWVQTAPASGYHEVTVTSGTTAGSYNFGNIHGGVISGYKWNDADGDGQWGEESTLSGVVIHLYRIDGESETLVDTDMTDESGHYAFINLLPGVYRVAEDAGTMWMQTYPVDESGHEVSLSIVEGDVETSSNNNFGNIAIIALTGAKFNDLDHDGYWDGVHGTSEDPEPGIADWTIYATPITEEGGTEDTETSRESKTTITDENGEYVFKFLATDEGWWRISEGSENGWEQTFPTNETGYYDVYIGPEGPVMLPEIPDLGPMTMSPFMQALAWVTGADVVHAIVYTHEAHYDSGDGVYEYYDFGNWQYPTVDALKWSDANQDGVRNWTDVEQEGNTSGVKDENESYTESVVAGWPMALGRVVGTSSSEEEGPVDQIDIEIVDLQLTGSDGIAHLRAPVGNQEYLVLEATQDGWTPIAPSSRNESVTITGYADGVDDSYTLNTDSFFDVYVGQTGGHLVTAGSSESTFGDERQVTDIAFGNFEEPQETSTNDGGGNSGGNGQIVGSSPSAPGFTGGTGGEVLGATTETPNFGPQCQLYLTTFIGPNRVNDPEQVRRLQHVLKMEGYDVPEDGVYGQSTYNAVRAFQTKYADEILAPWGLKAPTGFVYLTTRKKINELYCHAVLPLNEGEQAIINSYRSRHSEGDSTGGSNNGGAPSTNQPAQRPENSPSENTETVGQSEDTSSQTAAVGNALMTGDNPTGGILQRIRSFFGRVFGH